MSNIYCAGPLFNKPERDEMELIALHLEQYGHSVFLPHRDGFEFANLRSLLLDNKLDERTIDVAVSRAIFSLDLYKLVVETDVTVANLNGRVPDEGTVVEAALAWHARKVVILYKKDERSLLNGSDNPMLMGLGNFRTISDIGALSPAIEEELSRDKKHDIENLLALGAELSTAGTPNKSVKRITQILLNRLL
jgi:nucleoside 2-deoxyribosyltransferase